MRNGYLCDAMIDTWNRSPRWISAPQQWIKKVADWSKAVCRISTCASRCDYKADLDSNIAALRSSRQVPQRRLCNSRARSVRCGARGAARLPAAWRNRQISSGHAPNFNALRVLQALKL